MVLGVPILKHFRVYCDPSLEPSHLHDSNEGSQHMFSLRNMKNHLNYPPKHISSRALKICFILLQVFEVNNDKMQINFARWKDFSFISLAIKISIWMF